MATDGHDELFLIDGNSLAYRAFFALPESIATSTGFPTNTIFGFASMLVKLLTEYGPKPTIVVWDAGTSGRKDVSEDYKATRRSRPDLLKEQWPHLEPLVEAFGYRNVHVDGFEADDVIASIADRAREEGVPVMVVTGDRDAFQIIDPESRVKVMATGRGITDTKIYDHRAVIDRYGIGPELIPDFYGLKGDTSDNIPGVPGIGDKTASELLQRFGTLEEVLGHIDDISGAKRKENLTAHADDARLSKLLATIKTDVPVEVDPVAEAAHEPDRSKLRQVFREFELRAPLARLEEAFGEGDAAAPAPVAEVTLKARVRAGSPADVAGFERGKEVTVAVRAPEIPEGQLVPTDTTWQFGVAAGENVLVGPCDGPEALVAALGDRKVVAHDAKELRVVPPGLTHDTVLAAYLLEPARRGFPFREICEERGLASDLAEPAGADAVILQALAAWQREQLADRGLEWLMNEVELPLVSVLRDMELAGVRLNRDRLAEVDARVREEIDGLEREIWDLADEEFVIGSPQQLGADALRQARAVEEAPRQDRLLDRRARAAGDPRRAPDRAEDRALARAQPDPQDLPRRAAAADRRRVAHPHDVRAGRRDDRAAGVDQPEPAERPGPHRARARDPRLLRGRAGQRADLPPTTRRSSCASWPTSPTSRCSRRSSSAARTSTLRPASRSSARRHPSSRRWTARSRR